MKTLLKSSELIALIMLISINFLSCSKDDPVKDETLLHNCDESIDPTIVFDTIWKVDAKSGLLFTNLYDQKYFATTDNLNTFDIYSVESGEHLIETPGNFFIDFRDYEIQISGDYCILFDQRTQLYIYHDIQNDKTLKKAFLENVGSYTVDSKHVYFSIKANDLNYIIRSDFKLTYSDTICTFHEYGDIYNGILLPYKADKEILIYLNHNYPDLSMDFINLNDKTIDKHLKFNAFDRRLFRSKIRNDHLLVSLYGTFISMALKDDFQFIHINDEEIPFGYAQNISNSGNINKYGSITFLTDFNKIQAFDQKSKDLIWSCEHPWCINYLSSISLIEQNGDKEEFVIINEDDSFIQLLDPLTGIIKSMIRNKQFYRIIEVYNDQSFIALDHDHQLYKLKIRREK